MCNIKEGRYKPLAACLCQPISWSMATILHDSVAVAAVVCTRPWAIPLAMITIKINSSVSFSFLYEYGAPLGGSLGRRSSAIIVFKILTAKRRQRIKKVYTNIMDKSSWDTPRKNLFRWTREFFNLQFAHFDPLSPFQCCNHVTVSTDRISTLKTRSLRGVWLSTKKMFFQLNYGRTPIESICFAQMCQHFCPWL